MDNNNNIENNKSLPFSKIIPNIITLLALSSGLSAIRYGLDQKWEIATTLIIIATFLDLMDGRLARLLNATSNFGAQLDSLADFVNFCIVPPFLLYLWKLKYIPIRGLAWAVVLFYAICGAIRLAKFNCSLDEESKPEWHNKFFIGVPSTAAGILVLIPLIISFDYEHSIFDNYYYLAAYIIFTAFLMPSRIPTLSTKKLKIRKDFINYILVIVGIILTSLMIEPWTTIVVAGIFYWCTIPFSIYFFHKNYQ